MNKKGLVLSQIKAIHDTTIEDDLERYVVVLFEDHNWQGTMKQCLILSSLLGLSHFSSCMEGDHLGKKIEFDDLPTNIQEQIIWRLGEEELENV